MALGSLSSRLAGNGCRCFLGCETTGIAASSQGLASGDVRNHSRRNPVLGCSAIHSARTTSSTGTGRDGGSDPDPQLRWLPDSRSAMADSWPQSRTHYVGASPLHLPHGVLGKVVEPRFPSACPRIDFSPAIEG